MPPKKGGERSGPFYHTNDISVYLGNGGGGMGPPTPWIIQYAYYIIHADTKNELETFLYSVCPSAEVPNVYKAEDLPLVVQVKEHVHEMCSFDRPPLPHSVYL